MLGNLQQPGAGGGSGGGRQPSVPPHVVSPAFADHRTLETKLSGALPAPATQLFIISVSSIVYLSIAVRITKHDSCVNTGYCIISASQKCL